MSYNADAKIPTYNSRNKRVSAFLCKQNNILLFLKLHSRSHATPELYTVVGFAPVLFEKVLHNLVKVAAGNSGSNLPTCTTTQIQSTKARGDWSYGS
jgi:hypothetical protein